MTVLSVNYELSDLQEIVNDIRKDEMTLESCVSMYSTLVNYPEMPQEATLEQFYGVSLEDRDNVLVRILSYIIDLLKRISNRMVEAIKVMMGVSAKTRRKMEVTKDIIRDYRGRRLRHTESIIHFTSPQRLSTNKQIDISRSNKQMFITLQESFNMLLKELISYNSEYDKLLPSGSSGVISQENVDKAVKLSKDLTKSLGYRNDKVLKIATKDTYPGDVTYSFGTVQSPDGEPILKSIRMNRSSDNANLQELRVSIESLNVLEEYADQVIRFTREIDASRSSNEQLSNKLADMAKSWSMLKSNRDLGSEHNRLVEDLAKFYVAKSLSSSITEFNLYRLRYASDINRYIHAHLKSYQ